MEQPTTKAMDKQDKRNDKTDEMMDSVAEQVLKAVEIEKPILKLCGEGGNAFTILGLAQRVARRNKMDWEKIRTEATSGDYNHLLATMLKHFDVR